MHASGTIVAAILIVVGIVGGIAGLAGRHWPGVALAGDAAHAQGMTPARLCTLVKNSGSGGAAQSQMARVIHASLGCTLVEPKR